MQHVAEGEGSALHREHAPRFDLCGYSLAFLMDNYSK